MRYVLEYTGNLQHDAVVRIQCVSNCNSMAKVLFFRVSDITTELGVSNTFCALPSNSGIEKN